MKYCEHNRQTPEQTTFITSRPSLPGGPGGHWIGHSLASTLTGRGGTTDGSAGRVAA